MAVKISELSASAQITSDDFLPIVDSGSLTTKRASAQQVLEYVTGSTFDSLTVTTLTGSTVTGSTALFDNITASVALFNGDIRVLGTASIGQLNTVTQQSLIIGDKYITILSGGVDHTGINGAGFLWGTSSGPGETTGALGEHAHVLYDASRDALEIFPGLYVTGSTTVFDISGTTAQFTTLTGSTVTGTLAKFTTISASNAQISGNLVIYGSASFTENPDYAYVLYNSTYDKIVTYPGLYVSGNLTGSGLGAFQTVSASTYLGLPTSSGGTPGGTNTTIQFNSGSTFSGSANLVYNYSNRNLILTGAFSHFTSSGILSYIATSTDVAGGVTYNFGQGIAGQNGSFWYRNSSAGVGGLANNSQFWIFSDTGASSGLLLSAIGTTAPIIFSQGGYTSNNERLRISNTEVVSNNPNQSINFRVGASGQSNALFVEGSSGRVGIGTNTPGSSLSNIPSLDVVTAGDTKIMARTTGGAGAAAFVLQSTGHTSNPYMEFQFVPSSTDGQSYVRYNYVGATTKTDILTIQSNSRVGINKSSPNSTLDVNGNTIITGTLNVTSTTTLASVSGTTAQFTTVSASVISASSYVGIPSALPGGTNQSIQFNSGSAFSGSSNLVYDYVNNRLGIGTSNPNAKLNVSGVLNIDGNDAPTGAGLALGDNNSGGYKWIQSFNSQPIAINPLENNVGIGTSIPQYKLTVGDSTIGLSTDVISNSPNAAALRFGDASGWKFHIARAKETAGGAFNTGSTGVLVTFQDNGNVGIGTTSPAARLHISGNTGLRIDTSSSIWADIGANIAISNYLKLRRPNSTDALAYIGGASGGAISGFTENDFAIRSEADLHLAAGGNTTRLFVSASGNVGIGTTNPVAKLDVDSGAFKWASWKASTTAASFMGFVKGGTTTDIGYIGTDGGGILGGGSGNNFGIRSENDLLMMAGSAERARINSAGNVGIGTTAPNAKLNVNGGIINIDGNDAPTGAGLALGDNSSGGYKWIQSFNSQPLYINPIGNNTILNINGGGIGIGTATPNVKLDVNGNTTITGTLNVTNGIFVSGSSIYGQVAELTSSTTSYTLVIQDSGKFLNVNSGSAVTVTVPTGLPTGFTVSICQLGSGSVSFVTGSGVTINNRQGHTKTAGQYAVVSLVGISANTYVFAGDTSV